MQFSSSVSSGVVQLMNRVYLQEGLHAFTRGINSVILSAGPAHALYFAAYEQCKEKFVALDNSEDKHISHATAGAVATVFHDGFVTPFDGKFSFFCTFIPLNTS
jgi:solute carrier family 25 iron transporter 28/37